MEQTRRQEAAANGFVTVSLGDWIGLAEKTDTPHVPAVEIAWVRVEDLLQYDSEGPHTERLKTTWKAMEASRRPGTMLRWDCCASAHLKHLMARGRAPKNEVDELQSLVIDERVYELACAYPREELPVWQRPWIRNRMIITDGYPVEYRAFVANATVAGISSYYPQRPLRRHDYEIDAVAELASRLATALGDSGRRLIWPMTLPGHPEGAVAEKAERGTAESVHFTVDFAVTSDEGVILIEGGPPHFAGAHPCCFEHLETIEGIALKGQEDEDDDESEDEGDETG